jgi:hypothetical protein
MVQACVVLRYCLCFHELHRVYNFDIHPMPAVQSLLGGTKGTTGTLRQPVRHHYSYRDHNPGSRFYAAGSPNTYYMVLAKTSEGKDNAMRTFCSQLNVSTGYIHCKASRVV